MSDEMNKLPYAYHHEFKNGSVLSLDNLVIDYFISVSVERCIDLLASVFERNISDWSLDKFAKLNCKPSTKYGFFQNHIWGGGFNFSVGTYEEYDRENDFRLVLPFLRLKFNPNKYYYHKLLDDISAFLREYAVDGQLVKYDLAFDVPVPLSAVHVHSRKEPGLYKGTRYFGQRNRHGHLKIYDKQKDAGLDAVCTRIEWTFRTDKKRTFDYVSVVDGARLSDYSALSLVCRNYVAMLLDIDALGGDAHKHLERLDYRTAKKIEPFVVGTARDLIVDDGLADDLLDAYSLDLRFSWRFDVVKLGYSPDGFVSNSSLVEDDADEQLDFELPY